MNTIVLSATSSTPAVEFDFTCGRLSLRGESWPENAAAFYRPLIVAVEEWQGSTLMRSIDRVSIHVALSYFNSSSTKMLFGLFGRLNEAASGGINTELHWYYDGEDDISEEFGHELSIDFPAIAFHMHPGEVQ
ncbi:DUF1987 domain-containing protein [Erwinia sp. Eh17-17]|jgi:hypothetical protein|uniref:DUF1987 domain-containing protein n=1 Tax=Erwinia sp. Eh17-17 TaxID=3080330 RepID=UPI0032089599